MSPPTHDNRHRKHEPGQSSACHPARHRVAIHHGSRQDSVLRDDQRLHHFSNRHHFHQILDPAQYRRSTWDSSYKLAYVSGPLSDQADIPLEGTVAPNATYTFTKEMTAPDSSGNKREDWRLVAPDGSTIKVGSSNTIYTIIYVTLTADGPLVSETVPDGTQFVAGTPFVKQWTIRNKGISTWHPGYELRFHSGGDLQRPSIHSRRFQRPHPMPTSPSPRP